MWPNKAEFTVVRGPAAWFTVLIVTGARIRGWPMTGEGLLRLDRGWVGVRLRAGAPRPDADCRMWARAVCSYVQRLLLKFLQTFCDFSGTALGCPDAAGPSWECRVTWNHAMMGGLEPATAWSSEKQWGH